jgi:hypothetical protein
MIGRSRTGASNTAIDTEPLTMWDCLVVGRADLSEGVCLLPKKGPWGPVPTARNSSLNLVSAEQNRALISEVSLTG